MARGIEPAALSGEGASSPSLAGESWPRMPLIPAQFVGARLEKFRKRALFGFPGENLPPVSSFPAHFCAQQTSWQAPFQLSAGVPQAHAQVDFHALRAMFLKNQPLSVLRLGQGREGACLV